MITDIVVNPDDWKKECFIANKLEVLLDDEGNEIVKYDIPKRYYFNYQPVSSSADIAEFGENSKIMQKAVIPIKYKNMFKEFDVAYLNGQSPNSEKTNGDNANYRLMPPRIGNSVIIIYFEKIIGK